MSCGLLCKYLLTVLTVTTYVCMCGSARTTKLVSSTDPLLQRKLGKFVLTFILLLFPLGFFSTKGLFSSWERLYSA